MLNALKALFKSNDTSSIKQAGQVAGEPSTQELYKTIASAAFRMPPRAWDRLRIEMEFSDTSIDGAGEIWFAGAQNSEPLSLDLLASEDEMPFVHAWQALHGKMASPTGETWVKGMLDLRANGSYAFEYKYPD
jgi:hypothetical protein